MALRSLRCVLPVLVLVATAAPAATTAWNETVQGELSGVAVAPTVLSLVEDVNSLLAVSGGGDQDYFTFTLAAGQSMTAFIVSSYVSSDSTAFVAIQAGSSWTAGFDTSQMLAFQHFGPGNVGNNILGIAPATPLGPGSYTVWAQQLGASTSYQFDMAVVPEPGVFSLLLLGAGVWTLRRIRRPA